MSRIIRGHAQYNNEPDTRPTGPGGIRDHDPKRPGGSTAGTPREQAHVLNHRPPKKRWPNDR